MTVDLSRSAGFILAVAYRGAEETRAVPVRRWDHERLEGRSPQQRHCGRAAKSVRSQPHHLSGQRSSTSLSAPLKPETCIFWKVAIQFCIMSYRRLTVILLFQPSSKRLSQFWLTVWEIQILHQLLRPGLSSPPGQRTLSWGQYREERWFKRGAKEAIYVWLEGHL